jgi:hypothetical protein
MSIDFKDTSLLLDKITDYFKKLDIENEILEKRFSYFTKWLENNDFDDLLYKIIIKHGDEYHEKCYLNGCEAYPNNLLEFILRYVDKYGKVVEPKELKSDYAGNIIEFKDYYFQKIYGQGTVHCIYNKKDMNCLLQL